MMGRNAAMRGVSTSRAAATADVAAWDQKEAHVMRWRAGLSMATAWDTPALSPCWMVPSGATAE
jgi:hypothetical protein